MPDRVLTVTAWIAAATTALVTTWKTLKAVWKMAQRISDMWELVEKELKVNGGTSIRDKVDTIVLRLDSLERLQLDDYQRTVEYRRAVLHRLHILDGGPGDYTEVEGVPV